MKLVHIIIASLLFCSALGQNESSTLSSQSGNSSSSSLAPHTEKTFNLVCELCYDGLNVLGSQIGVLDQLTDKDLGHVVDSICQLAPRQFPIVDTLCVVLRDDLVDALTKLARGLKAQTSPEQLCGLLKICK
uniref:Saposin B-type domain-containing protein n=1 Tax=Caenorhabditis japonica TaxID=281687 RepID=A0A8R1DIN1_CAEJA